MAGLGRPHHVPQMDSAFEVEHQFNKQLLNSKFLELRLSQELQSKLDLHSIIKQFSGILSEHIEHCGIQLSTSESPVVTIEGQHGQHKESVELILEGEEIGAITLMKRQRFGDWEAIFFRYLARYLVYPVKNALLIQALHHQTITDPLTGSFNRGALEHDLALELDRSSRNQTPLAIAMLDIDHFKQVNDRYGHHAGDAVLQGLAAEIRSLIRGTDSLYRYGGEEFTLLMRDTDLGGARQKLESIIKHFRPIEWNEVAPGLKITLSAGVTTWKTGEEGQASINRADQALYDSKHNGRDRLTVAI